MRIMMKLVSKEVVTSISSNQVIRLSCALISNCTDFTVVDICNLCVPFIWHKTLKLDESSVIEKKPVESNSLAVGLSDSESGVLCAELCINESVLDDKAIDIDAINDLLKFFSKYCQLSDVDVYYLICGSDHTYSNDMKGLYFKDFVKSFTNGLDD